jgi:hypothetical protein
MHLFLFRPYCYFRDPLADCSDGWTLYVYLALLVTLGYRRLIFNVLVCVLLQAAYYVLGFGLPGLEQLYHFAVGTLIGVMFVVRLPGVPPMVSVINTQHFTGAISYAVALIIAVSSFADVDSRIIESGRRYGIVGAYIMIIGWTILHSLVLFIVVGVEKWRAEAKVAYWKQWTLCIYTLIIVMTIGLGVSVNSYMKSSIALAVALPTIYLLTR